MLAKFAPRRAAAAAKRTISLQAAERQREGLVEWARTVLIEWHEPEWGCEFDTFGLPLWANDKMIQARLRHLCTNHETLLAHMDSLVERSARQDVYAHMYARHRVQNHQAARQPECQVDDGGGGGRAEKYFLSSSSCVGGSPTKNGVCLVLSTTNPSSGLKRLPSQSGLIISQT